MCEQRESERTVDMNQQQGLFNKSLVKVSPSRFVKGRKAYRMWHSAVLV